MVGELVEKRRRRGPPAHLVVYRFGAMHQRAVAGRRVVGLGENRADGAAATNVRTWLWHVRDVAIPQPVRRRAGDEVRTGKDDRLSHGTPQTQGNAIVGQRAA